MNDLIKHLNEPEFYFPGNFDTVKRANALLLCLCQEAADALEAKDAEIATQAKTIKELRYDLEGTQDMAQFYSFLRSHPDWLDWDIVPVPEMPPEWKGHDDDGMKLDAAINLVLGREIDQLYREL